MMKIEGYHCKKIQYHVKHATLAITGPSLLYCSTILAFGQDKDPLPYPASEVVVFAKPGRNVNQINLSR